MGMPMTPGWAGSVSPVALYFLSGSVCVGLAWRLPVGRALQVMGLHHLWILPGGCAICAAGP